MAGEVQEVSATDDWSRQLGPLIVNPPALLQPRVTGRRAGLRRTSLDDGQSGMVEFSGKVLDVPRTPERYG